MKHEWVGLPVIESSAGALQTAVDELNFVVSQMKAAKLDRAIFSWNQKHFSAIDDIVELTAKCKSMIPAQVLAKLQDRKSTYEEQMDRSTRDERRKAIKSLAIAFCELHGLVEPGAGKHRTLDHLRNLIAIKHDKKPSDESTKLLADIEEIEPSGPEAAVAKAATENAALIAKGFVKKGTKGKAK